MVAPVVSLWPDLAVQLKAVQGSEAAGWLTGCRANEQITLLHPSGASEPDQHGIATLCSQCMQSFSAMLRMAPVAVLATQLKTALGNMSIHNFGLCMQIYWQHSCQGACLSVVSGQNRTADKTPCRGYSGWQRLRRRRQASVLISFEMMAIRLAPGKQPPIQPKNPFKEV